MKRASVSQMIHLTECPVCGSPVRKVITPVGIVFKGSGFYVTDNKNGKASSATNGTGSSSKANEKEKPEKSEKQDPGGQFEFLVI